MDDIAYLQSEDTDAPRAVWYGAAAQIMSADKDETVVFGRLTNTTRPGAARGAWVRYGQDTQSANIGIQVSTPSGVSAQWAAKRDEVKQLAQDMTAGRRLGGPLHARSTLAQGAFASKIYYTFKIQAPFEPFQEAIYKDLQQTLNTLVFGKFYGTTVATAQ